MFRVTVEAQVFDRLFVPVHDFACSFGDILVENSEGYSGHSVGEDECCRHENNEALHVAGGAFLGSSSE